MIINWDSAGVKMTIGALIFALGFAAAIYFADHGDKEPTSKIDIKEEVRLFLGEDWTGAYDRNQGVTTAGLLSERKPYITPEQFGAKGSDKTFEEFFPPWSQAKIDRKFPGVGADPTWTVDRAAWKRAIMVSHQNKKPIMPTYATYYWNGPIGYENWRFKAVGTRTKIMLTGFNYTALRREVEPANRSQAENMISNTSIWWSGFEFIADNQTIDALDFNSAIVYCTDNHFNTVGVSIRADFTMWSTYERNFVYGGKSAILSGLAVPGDIETSSNLARFIQNRCHTCSDVVFASDYAYEVVWEQTTVEGSGSCKIAFRINFQNKTTAKNFEFNTFHFEQTGGATEAIFKVDVRDQKINLRNIIAHYPGLVVAATATSGGGVWIEDLNWAVGDQNGKWFTGDGGVSWRFMNCSFIGKTNASTYFNNPVPAYGKRTDVGYSSYLIAHMWDE